MAKASGLKVPADVYKRKIGGGKKKKGFHLESQWSSMRSVVLKDTGGHSVSSATLICVVCFGPGDIKLPTSKVSTSRRRTAVSGTLGAPSPKGLERMD